jgi:hypothetical protein
MSDRVSDETLRLLDEGGALTVDAIVRESRAMARELLSARAVVEAARPLLVMDDVERVTGTHLFERLEDAFDAYDRTETEMCDSEMGNDPCNCGYQEACDALEPSDLPDFER